MKKPTAIAVDGTLIQHLPAWTEQNNKGWVCPNCKKRTD